VWKSEYECPRARAASGSKESDKRGFEVIRSSFYDSSIEVTDMAQVEFKLLLPDSLAREAEANGLLTPEAIEALLRNELVRLGRVNQLFDAADRLADLDMPSLTEAEVEIEIEAVRNARRSPDASRR
jgi:hypothetical protein